MDIVTYGGGEILYYILNAIAAVTNSSDYKSLVKLSVLFGVGWIAIQSGFGANMNNLSNSAKWFFTYLVLYHGLMVPKSTVTITDKFDLTYNATIDNVPWGLAFLQGTSSQIGSGMAELFDQAYGLVTDTTYSNNGFLFGSKVLEKSARHEIYDSELADNMRNFVEQCIAYDVALNLYNFDGLKEATDIWDFMTVQNSQSTVRMFVYTKNGAREYVTCKEGATKLERDFEPEIRNDLIKIYRKIVGSKETESQAYNYMNGYLQQSNEFLMNMSKDSTEIMKQNLIINAINNSDFFANTYADTIATAEARSNFERQAIQGQYWLPMLKTVMESILFGLFPFVFLVFLLPIGLKVLMNYIKLILMFQAWPLTYSVIHLIISLNHRKKLEFAEGNVTLENSMQVIQISQDMSILAGSLIMGAIPIISLAIFVGAGMMAHSVGSFLGSAQASASRVGSEMTRGNQSLGSSSFDNHSYANISANKWNDRVEMQNWGGNLQNSDGTSTAFHGDGSSSVDFGGAMSKLPIDPKLNFSESQALESRASYAQSQGDSYGQEATNSFASSFESASRMAHHFNQAKENGESWTQGVDANTQKAFENIDNVTDRLSGNIGASGSLGAEVSAGGKIPFTDIGGKATMTGQISAGINKELSSQEQDSLTDSLSILNKSSQSGHFNITDNEGHSLNEEFNSSFNNYKQATEKRDAYYNESKQLSQDARNSHETGSSSSKEMATGYYNWLNDRANNLFPGVSSEGSIREFLMSDRPQDITKNQELVDLYMQDKVEAAYSSKYGQELLDDFNIDNFDELNINNNQSLKSEYEQNSSSIKNDPQYSAASDSQKGELNNLKNGGHAGIADHYQSLTLDNRINNSRLEKTVPIEIANTQLKQEIKELDMPVSTKTGDLLAKVSDRVEQAATPEMPKFDLKNPTLLETQGIIIKKDGGNDDNK